MKTDRAVLMSAPRRSPPASLRKQKGVVLFVALIVLVAMTLAGIALVRSVDTANVIAGNLAFKQGTLQAGDFGVEAAVTALPVIIANTIDTVITPAANSVNPTYWYYPTRRETDTYGVPTSKEAGTVGTATAIDWTNVPTIASVSGNAVQVVIDRLCQGPAPVTDLAGKCFSEVPTIGVGGSKKIGASVFTTTNIIYYRITARVLGPRNTTSMVQAIVSR